MDFEPNPQDVQDYQLMALLRQPGNLARLMAMTGEREQRLDRARDPWVVFNPLGPSADASLDMRMPVRRSEATAGLDMVPYLLAAATPGLPAAAGRGVSGLATLRRAYNARNEQVYGSASNYGYYGPGQKTFDAATAHGDNDVFSPLLARLGYVTEPVEHTVSPNIWKLLEGYR